MKDKDKKPKEHWSDRHKVLISVLAIISFVGSILFLFIMGDAIK